MIKAVVWDIGNVFAIWDPKGYYERRLGSDGCARFFAESGIDAVNEQIDLGAPARETLAAHAAKFPDWAEEIRLWFDDWPAMFASPVPGMAELFDKVKDTGVRMLALSNFGAETLEIAQRLHPVLTRFDEAYVSAHLRCIKPDPAIYAALEDGSGLSGDDLIFVDDKPENIEAARQRGWKGHLFQGAQQWRARLRSEGILPE